MILTLDLPADVLAQVQTDARRQNRDAAQVAAERLAEWYAAHQQRVAGLAEGQALLTGPAHSLDEADERLRRKYNLPDLSHLSREELAEQAETALAALPPEKIAEAERLGLL